MQGFEARSTPAKPDTDGQRRLGGGRRLNGASLVAVGMVLLLTAGCATISLDEPTCPSDSEIARLVSQYVALEAVPNPPDTMTIPGAECGRSKYTTQLGYRLGRVIGYKAGLTNAAVQKRFNANAPVRGTLFEKMILRDGSIIPAKFGARPLFEADLVVAVRSSAIHDAKTPAEVLSQITAIHPFIELPDLTVQDPTKITAQALTLVNVGARYGVLGNAIPVRSADPALLDALRDMRVRLVDDKGAELDSGQGSAILDHPLNAVIWLASDLRRSGITLQPGELLSLGSFTRLLPPKAGTSVKAVYEGLPGDPSVSVGFR